MTTRDWLWVGATLLGIAVGGVTGFWSAIYSVKGELLGIKGQLQSIELRLQATAVAATGQPLGPALPPSPEGN